MRQDILILGGGPAGLSTALHLAQLAPHLTGRVLVLEKSHYPRHKLCAGALTADAEVLLRGLGLDVSEVPHVNAETAHFGFAGRGLTIANRRAHALRIIRRDEFDAWLARKARAAGIAIREGVTARHVEVGPDGVVIQTDAGAFEADILVGADGSNGITRRSILPDAPIHTARALEVLVEHPHRPESSEAESKRTSLHDPAAAYFDFAPVPLGIAGYTWDFPTQVHGAPMRCWGIYDTNLLADLNRPPLKQLLEIEMNSQGEQLEGPDLQGFPIRWFELRSRLSVPRVILVGDAAGADGIFGEGISIALGYGRVAAEAIRDAIDRRDYSFREYRRRILLSPLGQALTVRALITYTLYGFHWAWFQRLLWWVLRPLVAAVALIGVLNWARRMR